MSKKMKAPAGFAGADGAENKTALVDFEPMDSISTLAAIGNPTPRIFDSEYLKRLLAAWDACYDYSPEPVHISLWQRLRAEISRLATLQILKSPVHPPIIGNIIVETAEKSAIEVGK